jgi:hypothetical protein
MCGLYTGPLHGSIAMAALFIMLQVQMDMAIVNLSTSVAKIASSTTSVVAPSLDIQSFANGRKQQLGAFSDEVNIRLDQPHHCQFIDENGRGTPCH